MRPFFFQPAIGNLADGTLAEVLNSHETGERSKSFSKILDSRGRWEGKLLG